MWNELIPAGALAWLAALVLAAAGRGLGLGRWLLALGGLCVAAVLVRSLPDATPALTLPLALGYGSVRLVLAPEASWLCLFGLFPGILACALGTPRRAARRGWIAGAALSLLGALGVFGLQDGVSFLVAWEIMSLGGAAMILAEGSEGPGGRPAGRPVMFMLALLEAGSVALLLAILLIARDAPDFAFGGFAAAAAALGPTAGLFTGVLLLAGFGAKLGLLPFYEWFPAAYGTGSGASGALLSGVVLNAAFFALGRGLLQWLPASFPLSVAVVAVGVLSSILAILYALQEDDWRELLSFSTAENAAVATAALGASLLFRHEHLFDLAGLAWLVALLHLAGHALAKGSLFLVADGVAGASGSYLVAQGGLLRRSPWLLGLGAVFAGMSLAAMPPQAGFVSEWYVFQTVFQGFHLASLGGRLVLALAGAGLALTAAVAFATFIKVVGIGLQGDGGEPGRRIPLPASLAAGVLGIGVLVLAAGLPWWLYALDGATVGDLHTFAASAMRDGWILVPLTAKFAFISPTKLVIVWPLLALLPLALLLAARRFPVRRAPVWYGGLPRSSDRVATTGLTFSNAMRTFYSFVYRPRLDVEHEHRGREYFVERVRFGHSVAPVFEPLLYRPLTCAVAGLARRLRALQSGSLNFYLALIGALLVVVLVLGST